MHGTSPFHTTVERTPDGSILDLVVSRHNRSLRMLAGAGPERELSFARVFLDTLKPNTLPVLLGSGAGYALALIAEHCAQTNTPLLVIDSEQDILQASNLRAAFNSPLITWIVNTDKKIPHKEITFWQETHANLPLSACSHPFYTRLDKEYYTALRDICEASKHFNFWEKVRYPRFQGKGKDTRILLLTSKYFLMGEITAACERLGVPHHLVQVPEKEFGQGEFVEILLEAILSFKPDFVFTINHLGVDREGILTNLLEKLRLPLASWFVDNPHLVLFLYTQLVSPWTTLFTWDTDNIQSLKTMGFEHVRYLPLGCDTQRFAPPASLAALRPEWKADVSFVGNSMVHKVTARRDKTSMPDVLKDTLSQTAAGFGASDERSIATWLEHSHPDLFLAYQSMSTPEDRLGYEATLTWEATRQYRLDCVSATFPFNPLIVGDSGWAELIPPSVAWRQSAEITYYTDLPKFYPCSTINFNCTSKQMKGAVNQRVFDVPATGSFILTDYREQVENLFEPGREIVCYHSPAEATELIRHYLSAPKEREAIAKAARKRVLKDHSYEQRILSLITMMREFYA